MPNQKLTDLTALPSVMASGDKVYVVRSGVDYQADQTDLQVAVGSQVTGLGTNVATFLATPSSANLAAALTDETGSGAAVFATNPSLVGYTLTGARVVTPTTLAGTEVDVTKPESVKALSSSPTLTFSNATPTTGTEFRLTLTADGTDRTATIPSSFSINLGQNRTTIPVPANTTAVLTFRYTGARWEVFGDPVATVGSGSYVLADSSNVVGITIDGGGSAITTGVKGDIKVPWACTIVGAQLLADQSGSIVIDVWKDTLANYPPTDADSITASAPPTLSGATNSYDTTLTGWTTSIAAGDTLRFNVDSAATVTRATLQLVVTRT